MGREAGITVIGFLLLTAVFGVIGFAVIKIVPLYMERMRVQTVLEDLSEELSESTNTATSIRQALQDRLYIENLDIPREEIEIARAGEGYLVKIQREARSTFIADLSFVVDIHEQIELGK
jgi:hypothetical protein